MLAVLSPYHLTTRDPSALAAVVLADRVLTFLPVPPGAIDRESVRGAMRQSPRYARLLEAWRWAADLFVEGVVASLEAGRDPLEGARETRRRVSEEGWVALRPFMHEDGFDDAGAADYLDAVSADLLKGGPDPGWSVPIVGGLDAFAAEVGGFAVRAGAAEGGRGGAWRTSRAQVAERAIGEQSARVAGAVGGAAAACSIAVPVPMEADAGRVLEVRRMLAAELGALRAALDAWPAGGVAPVRDAARAYAAAFERHAAERGGAGELRLVRLTLAELPLDAALMAASVATGRPGSIPASARRSRELRVLTIEPMTVRLGAHARGA